MVWVISSLSHVSVCLYDHPGVFRSFTHLIIFFKVLMTRLPSRTITSLLTQSIVHQQCRSIKLAFSSYVVHKHFNQPSCWPPWHLDLAFTLGLTPLKICIEATNLSRWDDYGNCVYRQQVLICLSLRKFHSFPSQSSWQLTYCSS